MIIWSVAAATQPEIPQKRSKISWESPMVFKVAKSKKNLMNEK